MAYQAIPGYPALLVGPHTVQPRITIRPNYTIVYVGDSLTQLSNWMGPANTAISAQVPITVINSGVSGNQASNIEADIPGRITNYNPDVVVVEVGVNDCRGVPGAVTISAFKASYDNILATVKATLPNVQIACVGILCVQEKWASSPAPVHFSGNPLDAGNASIDVFNLRIAESAREHGCPYVDVRTPGAVYESLNNLPEPGAIQGFLTEDGIHIFESGQILMSNAYLSVVTVAP